MSSVPTWEGWPFLRFAIFWRPPPNPMWSLCMISTPAGNQSSGGHSEAEWEVRDLSFSQDGIDLSTSQELWHKELPDGVTSLDISPDGRVLGSASGFMV